MYSIFDLNGKLSALNALPPGDDEACDGFVRATMEGDRSASAGKYVCQLCLPFFDNEERTVLPVLPVLPALLRDHLRPGITHVTPLTPDFSAKRDTLNAQHQSTASTIEKLLPAARLEKNRQFADIANNPRIHEIVADDVICPAIDLNGK